MEPDLVNYLPRGLIARMADPNLEKTGPTIQRYEGVVLIIDISGFSTLTERFANVGPRGAEQLSEILDTYFGRMTDIAVRYGGDVVGFVGDGMVSVWRSEGTLADTVERAIHCAQVLHAALRTIEVGEGSELRQRVSIGAGELTEFIVGGAGGRWLALTAGEPMRQAGAAYHGADPGESVVCGSAWRLVRDRFTGRSLASGDAVISQASVRPDPPEVSFPRPDRSLNARLKLFVPGAVIEYSSGGNAKNWMGEFRNVTSLFIGLPEIDFQSPHVLDELQTATVCVQRQLLKFGGSFDQLQMDDKGISALATFGLPFTSHEDDAVRGLGTAMAVAQGLQSHEIGFAIGIASGRVFFGDIGGHYRRHIGMIGSTVNLAARLMQAATMDIFCDANTRQAAQAGIEFSTGPDLKAKGYAQAVPVFCPSNQVARKPRTFIDLMVGREPESRRLGKSIDELIDGAGGLLVVRGEAGIGKSRILAHLVDNARRRKIQCIESIGSSIENSTPYFPWRRILSQVLLWADQLDVEAAQAELARRFEGEQQLKPWMPLLNDVIPLRLSDNSITRNVTGAARASGINALLLFLLRQISEAGPSLIVFDDFHWFDDASASVIADIIHELPGMLFVIGTRPLEHARENEVSRLLETRSSTTIELEGMPREAIDQLICQKLHVAAVPDELGEFVFERTNGIPFYSEEIVLAMQSAGLINVSGPECEVSSNFANASEVDIPNSLEGVIVSRIDRLKPDQQRILKTASVIGREFSISLLQNLHPGDAEAALDRMIDALLAEDIVRRTSREDQREFTIKHAILRNVVYELLPFAQRKDMHARVAALIERDQASDQQPYYAELAMHWERAEQIKKALEYLEKAAALALERHANRDAITHIRKGFNLANEQGVDLGGARAGQWQRILGDAHHELFEYSSASEHFKRSLGHLGAKVPSSQLAMIARLCKLIVEQVGLRTNWLNPAKGMAGDVRSRQLSHIHERLAEIAYFDNQPLPLLIETLASLNLAERSGSIRETVDGFAALSIGFLQAGQVRISSYYNRQSLAIAHSSGTMADTAYGHLVNAVYQATQGHWQEMIDSHDYAAPIYEQLGANARWHQTRSVKYMSFTNRGYLEKALDVLDGTERAITRATPAQVRSWVDSARLEISLAKGPLQTDLVERVKAIQSQGLHSADRLRCQGLEALALLLMGETTEAMAAAEAGLKNISDGAPTAWHIIAGIGGVAEVYLRLWEDCVSGAEAGRLKSKSQQSCRAIRRFVRKVPISQPRADILCGRYELLCGRRSQAERLWRRAIKAAERFDMPSEKGLALYEMGRSQGGDVDSNHLQHACAVFSELGATRYLNRARESMNETNEISTVE